MDIDYSEEKYCFHKDILEGLDFYYKLLDKIDPGIYAQNNFFLTRGSIMMTIRYLKGLQGVEKEHSVHRLTIKHPLLTDAYNAMQDYSSMQSTDLSMYKMRIVTNLAEMHDAGINILWLKVRREIIEEAHKIEQLNDKISYVVRCKHHFKIHSDSHPKKFVEETIKTCEALLDQYKELKQAAEGDQISEEVKRMVAAYTSLVEQNIEKNDLLSPLVNGQYDEFVSKLKATLLIPSFFDIKKQDKERSFHIYLLGIFKGRMAGYRITSNKESGIGRYDIALIPVEIKNPGVIIELKKIEEGADASKELNEALDQIDVKQYNFELIEQGVVNILAISIVFEGMNPHIKYKILRH